MGFNQQESTQAFNLFGFNLDQAMVWLVSKREERQFESELAQASVLSEDGKEEEALLRAKREAEDAASADICALFPDSIMLKPTEKVPNRLRRLAQEAHSTGVQQAAEALRIGSEHMAKRVGHSSKENVRPLLLRLLNHGKRMQILYFLLMLFFRKAVAQVVQRSSDSLHGAETRFSHH